MGYKLTLQTKIDNHVISHPAWANDSANFVLAGRGIIGGISLYVPHSTPNISSHQLMLGHIVSKAATELSYDKRSIYMKNVTTENNWTFELGLGDGIDIPFYVVKGFMQRDHIN